MKSQNTLTSYNFIKDEEGRIPIETETDEARSDESVLRNIALSQEGEDSTRLKELTSGKVKRVMISDLLQCGLIQEGDSWRCEYKGEVSWGRVTGNGEIEVNGETYPNPSRAGGTARKNNACAGWDVWQYRDSSGEWRKIKRLREQYREQNDLLIERKRAA